MNMNEIQAFWTGWAGGPNVLFAVRAATLAPLIIYTVLNFWEFFDPFWRHPLSPARDKGIWRVLSLLTGLFGLMGISYYIISGVLEHDRGGSPFRLIYANLWMAPFLWTLCLKAMRRRYESWQRKYLAEGIQNDYPVVPVRIGSPDSNGIGDHDQY